MNEKLMGIIARDIVSALPEKKRRVYQFIESIEDGLAQQSETKSHFLDLLRKHSPHHQAAHHFNMSIDELVTFMHEIEDEINEKIDRKIDKHKWIDFTEKMSRLQEGKNQKTQYFLFLS